MSEVLPVVPEHERLPADVRVYVNERGVFIPRGATALDAVRAQSSAQADEVMTGKARLTDSRGLPIDADTVVSGGTIIRVLPVRDREQERGE